MRRIRAPDASRRVSTAAALKRSRLAVFICPSLIVGPPLFFSGPVEPADKRPLPATRGRAVGSGAKYHSETGHGDTIPLNRGGAMSRAVTLRLQDVRRAFRVIGDCRDVGDDTSQWQELAMQALSRLVGAVAVTGGEGHWHRPLKPPAPVSAYSIGLDESAKVLLSAYVHEFGINADPIFRNLQRRSSRLETVRRAELVSDRDWYRAATFVDYSGPAGLDHSLSPSINAPAAMRSAASGFIVREGIATFRTGNVRLRRSSITNLDA